MTIRSKKKIIVVGDKVLITPEEDADRTAHGLYLPPTVKEKEKVRGGVHCPGRAWISGSQSKLP
jgi:co-chaperonin GroES (HSP10)